MAKNIHFIITHILLRVLLKKFFLIDLKTFLEISTIQTRTNENQAEKDLDEIIEKAKKVKVNNEKLKHENKKLKVIDQNKSLKFCFFFSTFAFIFKQLLSPIIIVTFS